jgi:hypothetical protein
MADENAASQSHAHGHVHGTHCYWDYHECRWVCRPEPEPVAVGVGAVEGQPCTS